MDQRSATEKSSILHMEEKLSLFYPLRPSPPENAEHIGDPKIFPPVPKEDEDYFARTLIIDIPKGTVSPQKKLKVRHFRNTTEVKRKEDEIWNRLGIRQPHGDVVAKRLSTPSDTFCDRAVVEYEEASQALNARPVYNKSPAYPNCCAMLASDLISKIEKWEKKVMSDNRVSKQTQLLYFAVEYDTSGFRGFMAYMKDLISNCNQCSVQSVRMMYPAGSPREFIIEFGLLSDALKLEISVDGFTLGNFGGITARLLRNPVLLQHDLRVRKKAASKYRDTVCEARNAVDDGYILPQVGCCYIKCRGCGNRSLNASSLYATPRPVPQLSTQYSTEEI